MDDEALSRIILRTFEQERKEWREHRRTLNSRVVLLVILTSILSSAFTYFALQSLQQPNTEIPPSSCDASSLSSPSSPSPPSSSSPSPLTTTTTTTTLHPRREVLGMPLHTQVVRNAAAATAALTQPQKDTIALLNGQGIDHVNKGRLPDAVSVFDRLLKVHPYNYVALVGRGSAHSLAGQLDLSINDFSRAIKIQPNVVDGWQRRGQTYGAAGKFEEAIADLTHAVKLHVSSGSEKKRNQVNDNKDGASGVLAQRGILFYKVRDFHLAIKDIKRALRRTPRDATLLNHLGQCYTLIGQPLQAISQFKKALAILPEFTEVWVNIAQAGLQLAHPNITLAAIQNVDASHAQYTTALHFALSFYYNTGQQQEVLDIALECLRIKPTDTQCLFMQGAAYMSTGQLQNAVNTFNQVLFLAQVDGNEHRGIETQHFAFYQREWAIYQWRNLNRDISSFHPDIDLGGQFKEYFTMGVPPTDLDHYVLQISPSVPLSRTHSLHVLEEDPAGAAFQYALRHQYIHLNSILQLNSPGFLSNQRQHRQAGLAAMSMAHDLRLHWRNNADANKSITTWRTIFDVAVRWRQLVSCNDSVWWIDQLDKWDDHFEGFGLRTPIVSGQLRVVRYYPYFRRTFDLIKTLIPIQYDGLSAEQIEGIPYTTDLQQLYQLMGGKSDFWVTSLCRSEKEPGRIIEGTRLDIKSSAPNGFDFSIRTPGSPKRWTLYDEELTHQMNSLTKVVLMGAKHLVPTIALKMFFYWVNFAPLTRGSAATGYVALHAILLAAGYQFKDPVPKDIQMDWEAMLVQDPTNFVRYAEPWVMQNLEEVEVDKISGNDWLDLWSDMGGPNSSFNTYGKMYHALNWVFKN
jgi:tetratricopeptide (TPR) repeat protein